MGANDHGKASTYKNWRCRCPECTFAASEYHHRMRDNSPLIQARDRAQSKAYNAATKRLRTLHEDEFRRLYAEERERLGI